MICCHSSRVRIMRCLGFFSIWVCMGMDEMRSLSQGIREKGRTEGEEKFILNMSRKGYTLEQIAECAEKTIEEAEAVIKKREPVLA